MKKCYYLVLIVILTGCFNEKIEDEKKCKNEKVITFKNDSLVFWFIKLKQKDMLKDIKIDYTSESSKYSLVYKITDSNQISIKNIKNLSIHDTITINLENNTKYKLYDFKNSALYGGKNFLGCGFGEYKVNGKRLSLIDSSVMRVY